MSRGGGALKQLLGSLGIKAPWKYTGPVSSPEYMPHLPKATDYRRVAPTSQPLRALVPQAEPSQVYDIKYYTRDTRRAHMPGGSVVLHRGQLDVTAKDEELEALEVPPTPNQGRKWTPLRSILEQDNNGYTV